MSKQPTRVDFYFDIVCPFAYTASTQLDKVAKRCNADIVWIPVLLGGVYVKTDAPQGKKSATSIMTPPKRKWSSRDLIWQCNRYGVYLQMPKGYPTSTLACMRLLTSIRDDQKRKAAAQVMYEAYFKRNEDLTDVKVLTRLVQPLGISDVSRRINDPKMKDSLREATDRAVNRGSYGVPTFFVGKEMFFGVDRLPLLEHFVSHGSYVFPPVQRLLQTPNEGNEIEFFFDFSSPWAFLGYSRLFELAAFGRIKFRPILLGAIFKSIGAPNTPMQVLSTAQRAYQMKDFNRWFKAAGVHYQFTKHFPIRSILPLRVFIVDNRTLHCIYRAAWQQNLNISDPRVLRSILDRNGFDGQALIEKTKDDRVKQVLKDNTSLAVSKGMFGIPTYVVNGDYDRFVWGQDRLDFVKDLCCGWKPPIVSSAKL